MKFCIPRIQGRGAGLGNEMIPWAKAFIASQVLGATLLPPAWGLNRRGYRRYFETSRLDWLLPGILEKLLPTYTLTELEYRQTGKLDFADAVREFEKQNKLDEKLSYVLFLEGMWGGYESIRRSRNYLLSQLQAAKFSQSNLYDLSGRLDSEKLYIAVHMRMGDFQPAHSNHDYRGRFSTSLPLEWYCSVCRTLRSQFGEKVEFMLFSDGDAASLAEFISEFNPVSTLHQSNTDCSDLLAMTNADLLICSVSSYSMWAAFLSDKPYIWFRPNLQLHEDHLSIWGHEPAQNLPDGLTAINTLKLKNENPQIICRGVPLSIEQPFPPYLIANLQNQLNMKSSVTDLIRYGAVPAEI